MIRCKNYTRTHRLLPSTLGHPGLCPGRRHTTRRRGRPQPPPLPISTHPPPRPYLSPLTAPVAALERIASTLVHPGLCPGRCHTTRRRGRPQPPLLSISTHPPPRPYLCPLAAPVSALEHSFWIKSTRQLQRLGMMRLLDAERRRRADKARRSEVLAGGGGPPWLTRGTPRLWRGNGDSLWPDRGA